MDKRKQRRHISLCRCVHHIYTGRQIYLALSITLSIMTGCSGQPQTSSDDPAAGKTDCFAENEDISRLSESCRGIFEDAARTDTTDTLETVSRLVARIGESGYPAVDRQNQVNMVNADQTVDFCRQAEAGKWAELKIFTAEYTGGLTQYELQAEAGEISVTKRYCHYENGDLKIKSSYTYSADFWQYTEEGYLLFRGSYFSQDYSIYAASEVSACTALRVEPLEENCREMNRKYILPVGYGRNNLFLTDWNGQDFGRLDFYDLFDQFYPLVYGEAVPYRMDENLGVGAVYRIPGEEFEQVILSHLQISREALQKKTVYFPEERTYEYRPRGLFDAESGEVPYPEVTGYKENPDGTLTLNVNAVYTRKDTSRAFSHEVVIHPLEDGGFRYVSNRVIPSPDNCGSIWRRERLTEEQWEEFYGED